LPQTMLDKIWQAHVVTTAEDGTSLLYIDRHLLHEGSFHAFDALARTARAVRRPSRTIAFADHYVPTVHRERGIAGVENDEIRRMLVLLEDNTRQSDIALYGLGDPRQGIVHVSAPEQGLTLPGMTIVCGDSHTSTHGALGALAFGIGASEVAHVLATQTVWRRKPSAMRAAIEGALGPGVTSKDVVLALIARIGADGGIGCAIEYAGSTIAAMSVEERMTLCNMSVEAGALTGIVAPDSTTFAYLEGRPHAPREAEWRRAVEAWSELASDAGAPFERETTLDASALAPMVTWGTSPEDAVPITGAVPDPASVSEPSRRARMERALGYMGLAPGTRMSEIGVDRVFIGSCTNARIEDLRAAARVVEGRHAVVPAVVVPGSTAVKAQAEREGLDRIFEASGFEWRDAGCSMCVGMNGEVVAPGERCASTSNRNYEGRQGRGARTHLLSPPSAAAAAILGHLADVRDLGRG